MTREKLHIKENQMNIQYIFHKIVKETYVKIGLIKFVKEDNKENNIVLLLMVIQIQIKLKLNGVYLEKDVIRPEVINVSLIMMFKGLNDFIILYLLSLY